MRASERENLLGTILRQRQTCTRQEASSSFSICFSILQLLRRCCCYFFAWKVERAADGFVRKRGSQRESARTCARAKERADGLQVYMVRRTHVSEHTHNTHTQTLLLCRCPLIPLFYLSLSSPPTHPSNNNKRPGTSHSLPEIQESHFRVLSLGV